MSSSVVSEERAVKFSEGNFLIKTVETRDEMIQAYHLRHRVFAERLKWVPERADRLESDVYDAWSTSIGVFDDDSRLLGLVRMTQAPVPFMLESEFSACLVGQHRVRKEVDTAEITRLAVDPSIKDRGLSASLMKAIFKGMYQWCLLHDVRYTYMVVEHRLLKVVQRMGWPCRPIGEAVALPPAEVLSIGGLLDLDEFRAQATTCRPAMLDWLNTTTPACETALHLHRAMEAQEEVGGYVEFVKDRQLVRTA
ncbi:MAG: GNAT family N-acetyltransferase [Nitrospira sp.]|nr:GNAT family N-acetyltransferase [Nitrospira sp.]MDR4467181.1 GNAT family N-acetyltransferase [Nitrospira sp.]